MTKKEKKQIADKLQQAIDQTNKMFDEQISHAYIIGWLQGSIKTAINELNQ